jgi:hypothetical protein
MGKGAYLKEKRTQENPAPAQTGTRKRKRKNHARKNTKRMLLGAICAAAVLVVVLLLILLFRDPLVGKWDMDEVTSYTFNANGTGALILPSATYEFTYTTEENQLHIDFAYEGAKDASYSFSIEGKRLTLEGGNNTTQGIFELTRGK